MPDKLTKGGPLSRITARQFNRLVDASEAVLASGLALGGGASRELPSFACLKAKNATGGNLAAGSVVQLGASLLSELARGFPWFEGATPSLDFGKHYAVFVRPVVSNEIDDAVVAGVVLARVNVGNTGDRFCGPTASQTYFSSAPIGPHRLLTPPGSTGTQDCFVALGDGELECLGKTDAAINKGASGTVSVWGGAAGSESDTSLNVTGYNRFANLGSGKWVIVRSIFHRLYLVDGEC